jgi:hypothetical protein
MGCSVDADWVVVVGVSIITGESETLAGDWFEVIMYDPTALIPRIRIMKINKKRDEE